MGDASGVMGFILPNHLTIILPYPIPGPYPQARAPARPDRGWLVASKPFGPLTMVSALGYKPLQNGSPLPPPIVYDESVGVVPT